MPQHIKNQKYKKAFDIINEAVNKGVLADCMAATCMVESIISERIISTLHPKDREKFQRINFHSLIQELEGDIALQINRQNNQIIKTENLAEDINQWRIDRNMIVHGFIKDFSEDPLELQEFKERAHKITKTGDNLARLTLKWAEQYKRPTNQ